MTERSVRLSRRIIEVGVVAYCVAAGSIGGALYASYFVPSLAGVPIARLILWQSVIYIAWALVLPLLAAAVRTSSALRTLAFLTLLAFVVIPIHAVLTEAGMRLLHPKANAQRRPAGELRRRVVARVPIDLIFYSAIAAVLFGRAYASSLAVERAARAEAERAAVAAQLAALRSRLEPHFLFNALQGIGVLIEENPSYASEMLHKLSMLLRLTLERPDHETCRLEEELRFLRIYLDLELMRFSDRLHYVESIEDEARLAEVPTFLLQPLVENAIRHSLSESLRSLTVTLSAAVTHGRLTIQIIDDGVGLSGKGVEFGTGLTVTSEQLRTLYSGRASLLLEPNHPRGTRVTVDLPVQVSS